jgi:hypothetical protein
MAWTIASLPFWMLGLLFLVAAPISIGMRKEHETTAEIASQFLISLFLAGIFLLIAAKVST